MTFEAVAVANQFIRIAGLYELDPLKMQKLVYFAHGWHLALRENPLIKESVEAWENGPVVPELYEQTKRWGSSKINEFIPPFTKSEVTLWSGKTQDESIAREVIFNVWKRYWKYSGLALSHITHLPNSPWTITIQKHPRLSKPQIPDELIRQYFERQLTTPTT